MRKVIMVFGIIAVAIVFMAPTYHTITIDGSNDFSGDEYVGVEAGRYGHITWDANNIYIGITENPLVNTNTNLWVVIDTDPQLTPTTGTGRTDQPIPEDAGGATYPFTANLAYRFYGASSEDALPQDPAPGQKYYVDGSGNWVQTSMPSGISIIRKTSGATELKIPRSELRGTNQIYIIFYLANNYPAGNNYAQWPTDNDNGTEPTLTHWFGYTLTNGVSPNDAIYKDRPLPAQFVSLYALTGNSKITLVWETGAEINNAGFEVFRKAEYENEFTMLASYKTNPELKGLGTSPQGKRYTYTDNTVKNGVTYEYKIYSVDFNGNRQEFGSITAKPMIEIPDKYALYQNYPNPFNPRTTIKFDLSESGNVKLEIYNSLGEKVTTLYDGYMEAGYGKTIVWDASGFPSGVYYYKLTAGEFVDVKKMILMK